jgi:TonB-dependent starch-binding outer membrane protein SusC
MKSQLPMIPIQKGMNIMNTQISTRINKAIVLFLAVLLMSMTGYNDAMGRQSGSADSLMNKQGFSSNFSVSANYGNLVSLDFSDLSLSEALETLVRKVRVGISYRSEILPDKKVSMSVRDVPVHLALYQMLEDTNLEPVLPPSRDVIVIREKELAVEAIVQMESVSGMVYDAETGEALPGVSIMVKVTFLGTSTDILGGYELAVPSLTDTLVFSYVGYEPMEVPINGRSEINVELVPRVIFGDEFIVIGYGVQRRSDITG